MSENTNGNYAIHRNGVGDKLTMDTNGNMGLAGGLTAASLNTGGAVTAGTVTASGALTAAGLTTTNRLTVGEAGGAYTYITLKDDESPNGVKYVHANSNVVGFLSGAGSWLSYWDNAGSQYNVGNINANDFYIRASGKWASQLGAGGVNASLGAPYWYHPGCGYGGPCNCPGNSVMVGTYGWWTTYTDAFYLCRDILY